MVSCLRHLDDGRSRTHQRRHVGSGFTRDERALFTKDERGATTHRCLTASLRCPSWRSCPRGGGACSDSPARAIEAPKSTKRRFVLDSLLEGTGFEPSVPRERLVPSFSFTPTFLLARVNRPDPIPKAYITRGPMVRIRLPPAASQERTVRLQAQPARHVSPRRQACGRRPNPSAQAGSDARCRAGG